MNSVLEFEQPIFELKQQIDQLVAERNPDNEQRIAELRQQMGDLTRDVFANLTPWQTVRVARHNDRPQTNDYLSLIFDEFVQLHGDKLFGDDPAMPCGFAKLDKYKVMVVGHQKGVRRRNAPRVISVARTPKDIAKRLRR